jgi:hypothetical protein
VKSTSASPANRGQRCGSRRQKSRN